MWRKIALLEGTNALDYPFASNFRFEEMLGLRRRQQVSQHSDNFVQHRTTSHFQANSVVAYSQPSEAQNVLTFCRSNYFYEYQLFGSD
jgi:hypothetical protein